MKKTISFLMVVMISSSLLGMQRQKVHEKTSLNDKFHTAASKGDLPKVKRFLKEGAKINNKDPLGCTALMNATTKGYFRVADFLLKKGANPNMANSSGEYPLVAAYANGHVSIMRVLLKHKADANILSSNGYTILMHVCLRDKENMHNNSVEVVDLMLTHGANPNIYKRGCSPLHIACIYGNTEIVKLLITYGAEYNVPDFEDLTPLMSVCASNNVELICFLVDHDVDINAQNSKKGTALMIACSNNAYNGVQILLKHKDIDVNAKNNLGTTALMMAAHDGYFEIVELLLSHGADLHYVSPLGRNALTEASLMGHKNLVKFLLNKGALEPSVELPCGGEIALIKQHGLEREYQEAKKRLLLINTVNISDTICKSNDDGSTTIAKNAQFLAGAFGQTHVLSTLKKECSVCDQKGILRKCGRCQVGLYCSEVCQKKDWNEHKKTCKKISTYNKSNSNDVEEQQDEQHVCHVCSKPSTAWCSLCEQVYYCGRECQKGHWKEHKKRCIKESDNEKE